MLGRAAEKFNHSEGKYNLPHERKTPVPHGGRYQQLKQSGIAAQADTLRFRFRHAHGNTGGGSAHNPIQKIKRFKMTVLEGVLGLTVNVFSFSY